jgi:hypothetical protein
MAIQIPIRQRTFVRAWTAAAVLAGCLAIRALPQEAQPGQSQVLDRVVAVVNQRAILASDIDYEIRLSVINPTHPGEEVLTRPHALEQLISRALVVQQIRREDTEAVMPSAEEVTARIAEIRRELPACVHQNCASDAGWAAFLAARDLTPEGLNAYVRYRMEILRFIEQRFSSGIHITPQEVEDYYRNTLLPQYAHGEAVPPLDKVAPRIEEILLEQKVNVMFDEWLTNLRKQGDIEILDPTLETPEDRNSTQATQVDDDGKGSQ